MEDEFEFECEHCEKTTTIFYSARAGRAPCFCPMCGQERTNPAEELGYEDPNNDEYE